MVFLAGSSLGLNYKNTLVRKAHELLRNIKRLSSFDMSEEEIGYFVKTINAFKPKFIRGYASSIYFFAQWIEQNRIEIHSPVAVLTTAEKLLPIMREKIETVFNTEVFDGYGLNDGGVSAFELANHSGYRIDTERSILEIVDENGKVTKNGTGKIIATSLLNGAFPFIRYDTGDLGSITVNDKGEEILTEIKGRQQEMLFSPEGKYIHGEFFTHIFWEIPYVEKFQVVQNKIEEIEIKIIPEPGFEKGNLEKISKIINDRSPQWKVNYELVDVIDTTQAGKYRFIINNLDEKQYSVYHA